MAALKYNYKLEVRFLSPAPKIIATWGCCETSNNPHETFA